MNGESSLDLRRFLALAVLLSAVTLALAAHAAAQSRHGYLYSAEEKVVSPHPCEVITHPYLSDGRLVASAEAGEAFGPLAPGSYLIRETVAPGQVRTRYLGVAAPGWTVVQLTCGTTGDRLDSVVHARRVPMNYYVSVSEAQTDTTFLGWERDYGDDILLHLHPDSLGAIDPAFKTLKENWEDFTVPEIVARLKALDKWMTDFGFRPLRGFASYTPANTLVEAMRTVGWDILHSLCPEQNWSDGNWAINHWGMMNQPYYVGADDFRKSVVRGNPSGDVLGMCMNSYNLYMPHVVGWGDNVCSPSHNIRWHRTTDSGDVPVRYENFLDDYLKVAEGVKGGPYFLTTGYEFGRTFGTRAMSVHNRAGCEYAIDRAKDGGKVVFATASDVADWYRRFCPAYPESVFTQRDYLAGTRIMDKPIDSGPSIGMEMKDYKTCFAHLSPLPHYHYDYTIPWHFKAADTTAPNDFAAEDRERVEVRIGDGGRADSVKAVVKDPLPRATPVCFWDSELKDVPAGFRIFTPPVLDDRREHAVVELPKGFCGTFAARRTVKSAPARAEFDGLVTPLWRVQTIGAGARRHCYAFVDTPLLSPCTIRFTCPRDCRIDTRERPLGAFRKGETVELAFTTRRTWYRFWGLTAEEIQPDAAAVAALVRAAAEWKAFAADAKANLAKSQAADDAFFRSVVPADETLLLDIDCFGNAVFGERSRAQPFDRRVYAANDRVTAKEYSDGGISYGKGKSFWVHPRGLTFQVEGLDSLDLKPTDVVRIRLCTVAGADEPLSYLVTAKSGWNKILGDFVSPADLGHAAHPTGERIVWNPPKTRTADGLMTLDVPVSKIQGGVISVGLRTNQKQVLDDWFADGGFIARLERVVVTVLKADVPPERLAARKAFSELAFGIFLHWGLYSSFAQGEWYLERGGLKESEYAKAANAFYPHAFDAREWVRAFKAAGARYVVFTTRHHDGFSMFDTKASAYDIVEATPYKRDVVKELAEACRAEGLKLGLYYSLMDWHRPDYPTGREKKARASVAKGREDYDSYFAFMKEQLTELLTNYGEILCIWFDGEWDHDPNDSNSKGLACPPLDWRFEELYAHIHRLQPACLILNNHHHAMRAGEDIQGFERDAPGENKAGFSDGQSVERAFPLETCDTMSNGAWGYQVGITEYKSVEELRELLQTVNAKGANLLLNIGPRADGRLPEQAVERLMNLRQRKQSAQETVSAGSTARSAGTRM